MDMDAGNLAKLVDVSYRIPTRENGWTNDGYEELLDNFGQLYADHFNELLRRVGPDEANHYYTVLMDTYLIDIAEMYYNGCINGPVMAVPEADEEIGPPETAPVDAAEEMVPVPEQQPTTE